MGCRPFSMKQSLSGRVDGEGALARGGNQVGGRGLAEDKELDESANQKHDGELTKEKPLGKRQSENISVY